MPTGSFLPPDIREQLKSSTPPPPAQTEESVPDEPKPAPKVEPDIEPEEGGGSVCPNPMCRAPLSEGWDYCAKCGRDLVREGPAKRLKISFTEEDVQDYVFRGYVIRDIKIMGRYTMTLKSSQPKDLEEIDDFVMNGSWTKTKDGKDKSLSEFYVRQMNSMAVTAATVQKMDGKSIGDTLADRIEWLNERGSAFVDLLSQKVVWFNQALTEYLQREDTILGS